MVDSEILRSFIDKIIPVSPNEIVYCTSGTKDYANDEFIERRFEFIKIEPIFVGIYKKTDCLCCKSFLNICS